MARRERYVVGLDVGTSAVVCIVGETLDDGSLDVVGIGAAESRGIKRGVVVNLEGAVDSIKKAVSIVGTDMLLRWATVLVLTGIDDSPRGYSEIALQRAKACEVIAQRRHHVGQQLRRVLQVRVDDEDRLAAGKVEAGSPAASQRSCVTS